MSAEIVNKILTTMVTNYHTYDKKKWLKKKFELVDGAADRSDVVQEAADYSSNVYSLSDSESD